MKQSPRDSDAIKFCSQELKRRNCAKPSYPEGIFSSNGGKQTGGPQPQNTWTGLPNSKASFYLELKLILAGIGAS
jgi:hypothetical protein